jgi:hypothetical protein
MTVPAIFNTGFYFEEVPAGYTDSQDLIDRMQVILTTLLAPADQWSIITDASTGTGRWRSPTIGGRFSDFLLARSTSTIIHTQVFDQNGNQIMTPTGLRRMALSLNDQVDFYAGPNYALVTNPPGGNGPFALMNMIDVSGIPGAVNNYTVGHAHQSSTGVTSQRFVSWISTWRNGVAAHTESVMHPVDDIFTQRFRTLNETPGHAAVEVQINEAGQNRQGGPLYQCCWVSGGLFPINSDIIVPIDDATTATFRVTNIQQAEDVLIAYRKA